MPLYKKVNLSTLFDQSHRLFIDYSFQSIEPLFCIYGSPGGIRTRDTTVKEWGLNHLTTESLRKQEA